MSIAIREETDQTAIEAVIFKGDLAKLSEQERVDYYVNVCRSLGMNPFTRPFDYIKLNDKLQLYCLRGGADQLRDINGIDITDITQETVGDLYVVTVAGRDRTGRTDREMGVVPIAGLRGDALANAMMKAMTKAKRRLTLSLCGLGWLDETEIETIPGAQYGDRYTGELVNAGVVDAHAGGERPALSQGTPYASEASPQQIRYLHVLLRERGWHDDDLHGLIFDQFGHESVLQLTRQQASAVIERIQSGPKWVDPRQQALYLGDDHTQDDPFADELIEATATVAAEPSEAEMLTWEHRERLIAEAASCVSPIHKGKVRLLGDEAKRAGLLDDQGVLAALRAAKERVTEQPESTGNGELPIKGR